MANLLPAQSSRRSAVTVRAVLIRKLSVNCTSHSEFHENGLSHFSGMPRYFATCHPGRAAGASKAETQAGAVLQPTYFQQR